MKFLLGGMLVCGWVLAAAATAAPAASNDATSADDRFRAIYEQEWEWRQAQFPGMDDEDDTQGSKQPPDRLPAVDATTQKTRLAYWDEVLRKLDAIDPEALSAENQVNYAVYRPQIENLAADLRFRGYEMPFNADSSFWANLGFMTQRTMRDVEDYRAYIATLADIPRYFDEQIANMRAGLERGFSVPRAVLDGRDVSIATYAEVDKPEDSTFYAPFKDLPTTIPADQQAVLRADAVRTLRDEVIPAYANLLTFFRETYVPNARTTLAAEALPDGKAYYRQQIREYTTLDLDPAAIHEIGLAEVARIDEEMQATMRKTGFDGDFAEFLHFLRTDPQFYAKTPQELLNRAAWIAKEVDRQIADYFGLVPRGRFGIVPVPPAIAPFWTAGRGGAHTYWLNTYDLPSRPLYNLPALTLHESSPGHSFQGSLVEEQEDKPPFRGQYISAYGEGWGLYAEDLGEEMGIYTTPYEEFGRLTYAMWRACRLVIDTGVHHFGWSRDRALAYLRDHTALSEHEVTTEVDRYISWPGQALSYKLGEMKILELRRYAEHELGTKFDIRAFHDAVLELDSVPLPVLEKHIHAFVADAKTKATEAGAG